MPQQIIFHIDMNSYFASCEQQANPFLRGKPIGVCEHLGGIVIAPSIEAKRSGVKTAMPVWDAKALCPKIILLSTDPEKYRATTARFLKVFYAYTEKIEKYSIDEAFLDMTENFTKSQDPWADAAKVAQEIKDGVRRACGEWIRCSVGIADSKFLAKIGSDLQKPDGLTVIRPEDKHTLYDRLNLTDVPGIARRTEANLNALGIRTLADLRDYPYAKLVARFGTMGHHLHKMGQLEGSWSEGSFGGDDEDGSSIKSMGHAYTLPRATADQGLVLSVMYRLSEMVGRRLRASGLAGTNVHCVVSQTGGASGGREFFSKQAKLGRQIDDGRDIFVEAAKLFESCPAGQQFKLVGVTVSGLQPASGQRALFDADGKSSRLVQYLDKINDKYGDFTVSRAQAWEARSVIRDSVGFGRMKEFKVRFKASPKG